MSSMASTSTYECHHCGLKCGGRTDGGYGAITGADGAIHAACSPDDPTTRPDCYRRVVALGEAPGALRGVEPLPVGVDDIRKEPVQT